MTCDGTPNCPKPSHDGDGRADALTRRQREVIHAIVVYQIEHGGRSPSVRNLRGALGLGSTATVAYHLDNLEAKGYIARARFIARTIQLL